MSANIAPEVIAAAQAAERKWKVPASVSIAQYGIESAWGKKSPGCNPFGIKHIAGYGNQHFLTHEVVHGVSIACQQTFAMFPNITTAFDIHAKLLANAACYKSAMDALPDIVKFVALMSKHYATDPNYAKSIMAVIDGDKLIKYDLTN